MGAAIAQWIRLCPPSSGPEFEFHVDHQCLNCQFFPIFVIVLRQRTKINKKRPCLDHIKEYIDQSGHFWGSYFIFHASASSKTNVPV